MPKMEIHPVAAMFPRLSKQELQELADDIEAHGQLETIKTSSDGKMIYDGINRYEACLLKKIEPRFEALNGEAKDIESYIISRNIARRHLNAGQRALLVAMIYPDPETPGKKGLVSKAFPMVNSATLNLARRILRSAPDKVSCVLDGSVKFDHALQEAKNREELAQSTDSKMEKLREDARDLADLVKDEKMDVDEAIAAMHERKRKKTETIEIGKQAANLGLTRFVSDVTSILDAKKVMLKGERLLDKTKVNAVLKAAHHLQSLLTKEEET